MLTGNSMHGPALTQCAVLALTARVAMSCSKCESSIPLLLVQAPERILDAPDITDDYYLNLLDWSSLNTVLTLALQSFHFPATTCNPKVDGASAGPRSRSWIRTISRPSVA